MLVLKHLQSRGSESFSSCLHLSLKINSRWSSSKIHLMNKAENLGFWRTLDNGFKTGLVVM